MSTSTMHHPTVDTSQDMVGLPIPLRGVFIAAAIMMVAVVLTVITGAGMLLVLPTILFLGTVARAAAIAVAELATDH